MSDPSITEPLVTGVLGAVLFTFLALLAVASGVAVFRVDSMARATYALAVSFVSVGVLLVMFGLDYVGIVTILMMMMEMAVMGVYMVMFMGMNPALMPMDMTHSKRSSLAIAVVTFVVLAAGALLIPWPVLQDPAADIATSAAETTFDLGMTLMGPKMLVMLTVSPVLFVTIVAALVLAAPRGRYDRLGDDLSGPPVDPHPGGVGR